MNLQRLLFAVTLVLVFLTGYNWPRAGWKFDPKTLQVCYCKWTGVCTCSKLTSGYLPNGK